MLVTCEKCKLEFDDTYNLTFCPHEPFVMQTAVRGADGKTRFAHTVEELKQFIEDPPPRPQTAEERIYDAVLAEIAKTHPEVKESPCGQSAQSVDTTK
jgi:hypothetical protein